MKTPDTPPAPRQLSEERLQQNCYMWLHNTYPALRGLFFCINNNADSMREAMQAKAMGRVAGVADTCLLVPGGRAVFIEFKTPTGTQSPRQKAWQATLQAAGYAYAVVRTEPEFRTLVGKLLQEAVPGKIL